VSPTRVPFLVLYAESVQNQQIRSRTLPGRRRSPRSVRARRLSRSPGAPFEVLPNDIRLQDVLHAHCGYHGALSCRDVDQPLCGETLEGLPNGRAANPSSRASSISRSQEEGRERRRRSPPSVCARPDRRPALFLGCRPRTSQTLTRRISLVEALLFPFLVGVRRNNCGASFTPVPRRAWRAHDGRPRLVRAVRGRVDRRIE
jgi:hypothetical protein